MPRWLLVPRGGIIVHVASEFRAAGKHIRPIVVLDMLTATCRDSRSDGEEK